MKKLLAISYKGDRTYLQGGDFFNALMVTATEIGPDAFVDRLTFRRFACRACLVTTDQHVDPSKVIGQVRFRLPHDSSHQDAWLIESDIVVTDRRPFDEALLLANASLDVSRRYAQLPVRSIYTPIEDVIALTKHLNYAISPEVTGKWVFGQLDLFQPLDSSYIALEIQMQNLIANRFSVNHILTDGCRIGTIRFIVGVP
jgi:hypothetical protein